MYGTAALLVVGAVVLFVGWWGISGTTARADQYGWLNIAIAGVIVIGVANCAWLIAGRRRLAARAAGVYMRIERRTVAAVTPNGSESSVRPTLLAGTGMRHYHREDCDYVQGKKVTRRTLGRHEREGRRPCPVCRP